jgi:hypothetical protein
LKISFVETVICTPTLPKLFVESQKIQSHRQPADCYRFAPGNASCFVTHLLAVKMEDFVIAPPLSEWHARMASLHWQHQWVLPV